ncbi:MAG TPA: TIGR03000 domain-containing protein [Thermoguttaceae bacterium]|nr:TIGR03000 domain-containing protein [Thermoguttaceae bacterium]
MYRHRTRMLGVLVAAAVWGTAGPGHAQCCDCRTEANAVLTVVVPEEARVCINGHATTTTGSRRSYLSLGLLSGYRYPYEVLAEWESDGQTHRQTKLVYIEAGQRVEVSIDSRSAATGSDSARRPPVTRLTVHVPADARVYLQDREVPGTGPTRTFSTTRLAPGQPPVEYTIRATVERSGRTLVRQKTIAFRAGESHEVTFDFSLGQP